MLDPHAFERGFVTTVGEQLGDARVERVWLGHELPASVEATALGWWTPSTLAADGTLLPNPWADPAAIAGMEARVWETVQRLVAHLAPRLNEATNIDERPSYWSVLLSPWLVHLVSATLDRALFLRAVSEVWPRAQLVASGDAPAIPPATMSDAVNLLCTAEGSTALLAHLARASGLAVVQGSRQPVSPAPAAPVGLGSRLVALGRDPIPSSQLVSEVALRTAAQSLLKRSTPPRVTVVGFSGLTGWNILALGRRVPGLRVVGNVQLRPARVEPSQVRLRLSDATRGSDPLDDQVLAILPALFPLSVLERLSETRALSVKHFGVATPVLACNYAAEDVQNEFLARSVSANHPLWCAQHGGFYLQAAVNAQERLEARPGSEFWSWGGQGPGIVPTPSPRLERLRGAHRGGDVIVVIEPPPPLLHVIRFSSMPLGNRSLETEADLARLLEGLSQSTRNLVRLKPFPAEREMPRLPALESLALAQHGAMSGPAWMRRARLVIVPYPDTPFIEALTLDAPTIGLWNYASWELRADVRPIFDMLADADIIFSEPAEAARHVEQVAADPSVWWNSRPVRDAREAFVDRMARRGEWLSAWSNGLERLAAATREPSRS